jgi:antagonist of KipI
MQVNIIKPGLLTTLQDQGRSGYRALGIPVAGVMDSFASQIANILVGNSRRLPVLELTYAGLELVTATDVLIACCGGGSKLMVNGNELPYWKSLFIPAGIELRFKSLEHGCRTYISIAGGWFAQQMFNSNSTYLPIQIGGFHGRSLQAGDQLYAERELTVCSLSIYSQLESKTINFPGWGVFAASFVNYGSAEIRVLMNHESDWFDEGSLEAFFKETYTLSLQADRMGYHLDGKPLKQQFEKQLLSIAVSMGTLQVTTGGSMILLMADCQTTGGYPRIAKVAAVDLPVCAQLKPGDRIRFKKITVEEAESEYLKLEEKISAVERTVLEKFIGPERNFRFGFPK